MTYKLSTQGVSCFVEEAATSHYIKINRDDLTDDEAEETEAFLCITLERNSYNYGKNPLIHFINLSIS